MDKLRVGLIPVSGFVVQRGYLRVADEEAPIKARYARESIVDDFGDIVSADDVLAFARVYGFMGSADGRVPVRESIADWLSTAATVRRLVKAAEYVNDGAMPPADIMPPLRRRARMWPRTLKDARRSIAGDANTLIARSGLRPVLDWHESGWTFGFSNSPQAFAQFAPVTSFGCLAAVAYFALRRVMNRATTTYCSICGEEVFVARARPVNRAHYCDKPECRTEMWRRLKRRQRERAIGQASPRPAEKTSPE